MTKLLDEYSFRLKRSKFDPMCAWALREERVYLQMTTALARLEQTADSTEPRWNLLSKRQCKGGIWNNWSGSWRAYHGRETFESVDGDDDIAREAHSWSEREKRDEDEAPMQEMEARVNIPSHGQSTKDFFPDGVRGWLVLQRSGLSESSSKTVLGSNWQHAGPIENRGSSQTTVVQITSFWSTT